MYKNGNYLPCEKITFFVQYHIYTEAKTKAQPDGAIRYVSHQCVLIENDCFYQSEFSAEKLDFH